MLNSSTTYNLIESAGSMPVVLYRSEVKEPKVNKFTASALLIASVGIISLQAGFVLNASAQGNPISSPVTIQENPSPSPAVCAVGHTLVYVNGVAICVSQTQTQEQQNNNQNNNQGNGSTPNTNTNNPVTSPEVSPTPTPAPVTAPEITINQQTGSDSSNGGNNNGSSNNNSGGGSSSSAPSCEMQAPKAPKIVSAVVTGKNEITLNWEKPQGNVTHYSINYGFLKGKPFYGNANVGNVTSFKVAGLAGGVTYYFTVKAVNDCTPGEASNEVAVKVGGKFINTPAVGFKAGVLGKTNVIKAYANKKPALAKPVVFNQAVGANQNNAGLAGKVISFFKNLF